jgi:hypothetical protein
LGEGKQINKKSKKVLELGLGWWPDGWICANGLRQGRDKIETKLVIDLLIIKVKNGDY